MRWVAPYPSNRRITSPYGPRRHPISGQPNVMHRGIDIAGKFMCLAAGDPEKPPIFHSKGYNASGGGNWAKLEHEHNGTKYYSVYYHLERPCRLTKGETCIPGVTEVGMSGTTGASTGDHLHYEIRKGSPNWGRDIDPTRIVDGAQPAVTSTLPISGRLDRATVRKWQEALQAQGHNPGPLDGRMGPRTAKAIQKAVGVRADGVIGPVTRAAVQRYIGVRQTGEFDRATISELQRKLNANEWHIDESRTAGPIASVAPVTRSRVPRLPIVGALRGRHFRPRGGR